MFDAAKAFAAARWLVVGACLWGCGEILGLETPKPRPADESGDGGGAAAPSSGGTSGTNAGHAGMPDAGEGGTDGGTGGTGNGGIGGAGGVGGAGGTSGTSQQGGAAGDSGAGAGGSPDGCSVGEQRCGGETSSTPEVCDEERNWVTNDAENGGENCPVLCEGGECVECQRETIRCDGKVPQQCEGGAWQGDAECDHYCLGGACENAPSCPASLPACGNSSCCSAREVPGGRFSRDFDTVNYTDRSYQAELSSFLLDEFEVTVGRLRRFVSAYPVSKPSPGDGKAEHITTDEGTADEGWKMEYPLPLTVEDLRAQLACAGSTWTDEPNSQEHLPANCVDFFVAYAFCIWDGGRLPTEAEWNRAAAGGDQQRVYPWSDPPISPAITANHAAYGLTDPLPPQVGLKALGNGRWGHADLAGSVYEWTLDAFADPYESTRCDDCLATRGMVISGVRFRSIRGGSFNVPENYLYVSRRVAQNENLPRYYLGFRCARDIGTPSTP